MKKIITLFVLILIVGIAKAQWYSVPDTGFQKSIIQAGYASCMNANHDSIDAGCSILVNCTTFQPAFYIYDLQGIQAFTSLTSLDLFTQQISYLPPLPNSLTYLNLYGCSNLSGTSPTFPPNLKVLYCGLTNINITSLPPNLSLLDCSQCFLLSLPTLPLSLDTLICSDNGLPNLPSLPSNLRYLDCHSNPIQNITNLSSSLTYLDCSNTLISSLPTLPNSLQTLNCSVISNLTIPSLPNSLISFNCESDTVIPTPTLPSSLKEFYCGSNCYFNSFPTLPPNLEIFDCSYNYIPLFPILPNSLRILNCKNNYISVLPALPNTLKNVDCSYNSITSLPIKLPDSLRIFDCSDNNLIFNLPTLPDSLNVLNIYNTQIKCLPVLPLSITDISLSNYITCTPNHLLNYSGNSFINNLPICDSSNNVNGCLSICLTKAKFSLIPDVNIPHHWFLLNQCTGTGSLNCGWYWGDSVQIIPDTSSSHIYSTPGYYKICVFLTDSLGCTDSYCDSSIFLNKNINGNSIITLNVIKADPYQSGRNENSNLTSDISIFPNPVEDFLTIQDNQHELNQIEILNIYGQSFLSFNLKNEEFHNVNMSQFQNGIYLIKVKRNNGYSQIIKIIKK